MGEKKFTLYRTFTNFGIGYSEFRDTDYIQTKHMVILKDTDKYWFWENLSGEMMYTTKVCGREYTGRVVDSAIPEYDTEPIRLRLCVDRGYKNGYCSLGWIKVVPPEIY